MSGARARGGRGCRPPSRRIPGRGPQTGRPARVGRLPGGHRLLGPGRPRGPCRRGRGSRRGIHHRRRTGRPGPRAALHMINCGHPPPLLLRGGQVGLLEVRHPAPPLGLTEFVESQLFPETFAFEPGDIALLYTDGVVEARDRNGTFYPLVERVAASPAKVPTLSWPTCARTCCTTPAALWMTMPPWWRSSACRGHGELRQEQPAPGVNFGCRRAPFELSGQRPPAVDGGRRGPGRGSRSPAARRSWNTSRRPEASPACPCPALMPWGYRR